MSWIRLYLTVEGETELRFAKETLFTHLAKFEVEVRARMIPTNRKLGTRGGALNFRRLKRNTAHLMKEDASPEARFSTMIDLYALPADYPGWKEAEKESKPADRVLELEKALAAELADSRFIPFLQLHEFEALLYCDLKQIQSRLEGTDKAIAHLQKEVACFSCPEDINEGDTTAPSKRLIKHVPRYEKLKGRIGPLAADAIGLPVLRMKCPHFGQWLTRLEELGQGTQIRQKP
ncbi:MAG TPA: DUF4276 family protein [Candidatus Acidoferrum sp.]|nr:DUF4276 family protein [Candidatus Acidoferrum sp.]